MNNEPAKPTLVIYVDVDDTFVRTYGTKRIPMPETISYIQLLKEQGAELYCWSSGGAEYAKASAKEFGIEACFIAFLPKPQVVLDDQEIHEWRLLLQINPGQSLSVDELRHKLIHPAT